MSTKGWPVHNGSKIERRFNAIAGLVTNECELLAAPDLKEAIRSALPKGSKHARICLWFSAYMVFDRDIRALAPAYCGIGKWDRSSAPDPSKKLGRPNQRHGPRSGHSAIPLKDKIIRSYLVFAKASETMPSIYSKAMVHEFGCRADVDERGRMNIVHPENSPFPNLGQFSYWVHKIMGLESIQKVKYGNVRYRNRLAANIGKFSESTSNLLERTESDCFFVKEIPRKILSSDPGSPLVVCRLTDVCSGNVFGVGFAYGAETSEAYRSGLFFSVAPIDLINRMFGLELIASDFPVRGIPPSYLSDRGPGASAIVVKEMENPPPIREMTPSWDPQSKATSESSHPRTSETRGQPVHIVSNNTVYQMVKLAVLQASLDNKISDASARMTPEMIAAGTLPNPNGVAEYLASRGRNDAINLSVDRAVRELLLKVSFSADRNGLRLLHQAYRSKAFDKCGLLQKIGKGQAIDLIGYVMPLSVRIAWVEFEGMLYEVEAVLPIRDDKEQLYLPLSELTESHRGLNTLKLDQKDHATAARIGHQISVESAIGKSAGTARTVNGKPASRRQRREKLPSPHRRRGR